MGNSLLDANAIATAGAAMTEAKVTLSPLALRPREAAAALALPDPDQPLTPDEAAAWLKLDKLGYDTATLLRWAMDNKIGSTRIGHKVAFLRRHLVEFVDPELPAKSARRKLKRISA